MNINETSKRLGVSKETLRYWENCGLLPEIPRNESGYREYGDREIKWVLFVKAMRNAGMSIEALGEFINVYHERKDDRKAQKAILEKQYELLLKKRNELDKTLNYLAYKLENFDSHMLPFLEEESYYKKEKQARVDFNSVESSSENFSLKLAEDKQRDNEVN